MTLRVRFSKTTLKVKQCINKSIKKYKGLNEYFKLFSKREFYDKTMFNTAKWLSSQYNITTKQALGYLALAGKQAMVNKNGRISGHNNVYFHKVFDDIYQRLRNELNPEIVRHFEESEFYNKVREHSTSPNWRLKILSLELMAALQKYHSLEAVKISEQVLRAERRILGWVPRLWSKPAFWITAMIFLDTGSVIAGDTQHDLYLKAKGDVDDRLAIELGFGSNSRWYDRREYMNDVERVAWRVYDDLISEIGRELVAAGMSRVVQNAGTRALRLVGDAILTIASSTPTVLGAGMRVAAITKAVANFLDKSILVWLAGQVAIEWQLETWLAMHETEILRKSRDFWANYTPIVDVLGGKEQVEEYFTLFDKLINRKFSYLDYQEFERFQEYNKRIELYGGENLKALKTKLFDVIRMRNLFEYMIEGKKEEMKKFNKLMDYLKFKDLDKIVNDLMQNKNEDYSETVDEILGYHDYTARVMKDDDIIEEVFTYPITSTVTKSVEVSPELKRVYVSEAISYGGFWNIPIKGHDEYYSGSNKRTKSRSKVYIVKGDERGIITATAIAKNLLSGVASIDFTQDYPEKYHLKLSLDGRNGITYEIDTLYEKKYAADERSKQTNIKRRNKINVNIPMFPAIIILPLVLSWSFAKVKAYDIYDLKTQKSYHCYRYAKHKPKHIVKIVLYNSNLNDTRFIESFRGETEIYSGYGNSSINWIEFVSIDKKDYYSGESSINTNILEKEVAITSSLGKLIIYEKIKHKMVNQSGKDYWEEEGEEESISSSIYSEYETENEYTITLDTNNVQHKMITLEPIDLSSRSRKRAKIICIPSR
jgi:hypothetical protein